MENNNLRRNRGGFIEAILFGAASSLVGLVLYNSLKSETVDAAVPQQKKDCVDTNSLNRNTCPKPGKLTKMPKSVTNPNAVLKDINDKMIKLDGKDIKNSNKIIKKFVEEILMSAMRQEDPLFNIMYSKLYHTGSFYDGLKVDKPHEFDLDIVLDLNMPKPTYMLERNAQCLPGYVLLSVDNPSKNIIPQMKLYNVLPSFMKLLKQQNGNEKYFVDPGKIRSWIQKILDKTLPSIKNEFSEFGILNVIRETHGPALTLKIEMENMDIIDVDLVPVFTFKPELLKFYPEIWNNIHEPKWLNGHTNDFKKDVNTALAKHFLIVPKPLEGSSAWRLDFHDAEIQIIKSKQCAKPVIKLLKLFRDGSPAQIMKPLFSYSLKTIVMDMIRSDPSNAWLEKNLAENFLKALNHLKDKLQQRTIEYFFDSNSNLIGKNNPQMIISLSGWLTKTISDLEKTQNTPECKAKWISYFPNPNETLIKH